MDYLIADRTLIPPGSERHYTEKIVYLPDGQSSIESGRSDCGPGAALDGTVAREFMREELGLPPAAFVFCCFNGSRKIMPGTFATWMAILRRVPNGVLWLLPANPTAEANLRAAAVACGLPAHRLAFARRLPPREHLARLRAADLFLDTAPCNGRKPVGDALWAGLPVLTLAGEAFAGRVTAGLLQAAGLPELIATSPAHYEAAAVTIASEPQRLGDWKQRLVEKRATAPFADTRTCTRQIERAFIEMQARSTQGLPPEHIHVD